MSVLAIDLRILRCDVDILSITIIMKYRLIHDFKAYDLINYSCYPPD